MPMTTLLDFPRTRDHDHAGTGPGVGRRGFVTGGVALAGLAAMLGDAAAADIVAMTRRPDPVPERGGVVPWRLLRQVRGDGWFEPFRPSPAVTALDGSWVRLDGFAMPEDAEPRVDRFVLAGYRAHCPLCMPGGLPSMAAVHARQPIAAGDGIVSVAGRFSILERTDYGLIYRIDDAVPA